MPPEMAPYNGRMVDPKSIFLDNSLSSWMITARGLLDKTGIRPDAVYNKDMVYQTALTDRCHAGRGGQKLCGLDCCLT